MENNMQLRENIERLARIAISRDDSTLFREVTQLATDAGYHDLVFELAKDAQQEELGNAEYQMDKDVMKLEGSGMFTSQNKRLIREQNAVKSTEGYMISDRRADDFRKITAKAKENERHGV